MRVAFYVTLILHSFGEQIHETPKRMLTELKSGRNEEKARQMIKKKRKKLRMHFPKEISGPSPKLKPSRGAFLWQMLPGGTLSSGNTSHEGLCRKPTQC